MTVMGAFVACRPVDWSAVGRYLPHPETAVHVESVKDVCTDCGAEIWIGPQQQVVLRGTHTPTLCYLCVIHAMIDSAQVRVEFRQGGRNT